MKRTNEPVKLFEVYGQIADLKEVDYKNTLVITALIELLVEKGLVERSDVLKKAQDLDHEQEIAIERKRMEFQ